MSSLPRDLRAAEPQCVPPAPRWHRFAPPLALAAAVALAWGASLDASFQFDDWHVIVGDPRVHSLLAWWQSMPGMRPLLKLSYALNYSFGTSPGGFRAVNIVLHALNTVLVFALFLKRAHALPLAPARARFAALTVALLFALEPVQTESVTYISGRSSSLAACACLWALWCWSAARQSGDSASGRRRGRTLHLCGLLCYAAAAAVKETLLVLPLAVALLEGTWPGHRWARRERRAFAAYALLALAGLAFALALPGYRQLLATGLATRSVAVNLLAQAQAWKWLLLQLLLPGQLDADPQLPPVSTGPAAAALWALCWLLLGIGALWLIYRHRRATAAGPSRPVWPVELAFAVLWFYVWLLPTNSLLPRADVVNDRQLYLSLIGPAWLAALALALLYRRTLTPAWTLLAVLTVLLGMATVQRNAVYRTEIRFWQAAAARSAGNARAANNLGMAYALDCQTQAAAIQFRRAAALAAADCRPRVNLALLQAGTLVPGCASGPGAPAAAPAIRAAVPRAH